MKQTVYISNFLKGTDRGKHVAEKLKEILRDRLKEIPYKLSSKNEWCRDYMPVKASDGSYVLFKYMPSYMIGAKTYEKKIPDQEAICSDINITVIKSEIMLDGGAVEIFGKKGIVTSRVFKDNVVQWTNGKPDIYDTIKDLLKLDELIIVPEDPWDEYGHTDGMIRFIDSNTVLINDHTHLDRIMKEESEYEQKVYELWKKNFYKTLEIHGLHYKELPLPCYQEEDPDISLYMNFLHLEDMIIMPIYNRKEDNNVKEQLEQLYNKPVHTIVANELAKHGGIINCVTWQM